ncbi:hypothetical protein ACP70R_015322 [Stipagrostis hirtigluma subsp. patula]
MASRQVLIMAAAVVLAVACLPALASATDFKVGDDLGWRAKFNETKWTDGKYFRVGDTLLFTYDTNKHTLVEVGKEDFAACNVNGTKMNTWSTGNDRVTLDKPGRRWFICTVPGHCAGGMKLVLDVLAADAPIPAPAAPAPSSAPASYATAAAQAVVSAGAVVVAAAALMF